jgi:hypothetical protein
MKLALVIHGVDNRSLEVFHGQVHNLEVSLGNNWKLIPVFWGDLCEQNLDLRYTIPGKRDFSVRSGESEAIEIVAYELLSISTDKQISYPERISVVIDSAQKSIQRENIQQTSKFQKAVTDAISEEWGKTQFLTQVGNQEILENIGYTLGQLAEAHQAQVTPEFQTRGYIEDIQKFIRIQLEKLDQQIGLILGKAGVNLNAHLRTRAINNANFLSDIFVYQRHREVIISRVLDTLNQQAPGYGSQEQPINVVAHSLGGIIAFDAAISNESSLWIKKLITFGSQVAVMHLLDPRGGRIEKFAQDQMVEVPPTIEDWINIWEPLDPLAFLVGEVFKLSSGNNPKDIELKHLTSSGLWTHSIYWNHPTFLSLVRQILNTR